MKSSDRWDSRVLNEKAEQSEAVWARAMQWVSRTLAAAFIMVLPGIVGSMLDKRLETSFLAPLGFVLGLIAGTTGLVVLARRFTPPARGNPLSWEDEPVEKSESQSEERKSPEGGAIAGMHKKDNG